MMVPGASEPGGSYRAVQRRLAQLLPDVEIPLAGEPTLEVLSGVAGTPRLINAALLEAGPMRRHGVTGGPEVGFDAFLDGTQGSRILVYANGTPIIHGTVAAAIRVRRDRRLETWSQPIVRRALYAPRALLSSAWNAALDNPSIDVTDISDAALANGCSIHPYVVRDAAIHRVQKDREAAERDLATRWCAAQNGSLFVDGGISSGDPVRVSACMVGVVKSHRTLYAEGDALQSVFRLRCGERSSVFLVTSPKRLTVASWYLRLRTKVGHDPLWGLVRVEIAHEIDEACVGERANHVSRWILAEVTPVALPDGRWDRMVYGVRDCEEFLKAIT